MSEEQFIQHLAKGAWIDHAQAARCLRVLKEAIPGFSNILDGKPMIEMTHAAHEAIANLPSSPDGKPHLTVRGIGHGPVLSVRYPHKNWGAAWKAMVKDMEGRN